MHAPAQAGTPWFPFGLPKGRGGTSLFVFHHAGGAASFFQPWRGHPLAADIDVCPVELPGRGRRFLEPACEHMDEILASLVPAVCDATASAKAVLLFGHSLGALVAFEVALAMQARGCPPDALVASSRRAPQLPTPQPWRHAMSDTMLVSELRRLGGTREEVLQSDELLDVFLPAIRADFSLTETYVRRPGSRLECPLLCLRGSDDKEVSAMDVDAWRDLAGVGFSRADLPGDHFYLSDPAVLSDILARIRVHARLP